MAVKCLPPAGHLGMGRLCTFQLSGALVPCACCRPRAHSAACQVRPVELLCADGLRCSLLQVQSTTRLCLTRDLNEHDVVSRIMRKENYLIGMLNKGCLALHVSIPGMRKRFILSETLKWNLHRSVALSDRESICNTSTPLPGHCATCVAAPSKPLCYMRGCSLSEVAKWNLHRHVAPPLRHAGPQMRCRSSVHALVGCCSLHY